MKDKFVYNLIVSSYIRNVNAELARESNAIGTVRDGGRFFMTGVRDSDNKHIDVV